MLEKISYEEAREWFWVRTLMWAVPAALASITAHFFFSADYASIIHSRMLFSVGVGVGVVLMGIVAALASLQFPWMRSGKRFGFVLTGPACAGISAFITFIVFGMVFSVLQGDVIHPPSPELIDVLYRRVAPFIIGAAGFWGFCFGSWFALRRDKYYVELI